jgi:hypothetical protein
MMDMLGVVVGLIWVVIHIRDRLPFWSWLTAESPYVFQYISHLPDLGFQRVVFKHRQRLRHPGSPLSLACMFSLKSRKRALVDLRLDGVLANRPWDHFRDLRIDHIVRSWSLSQIHLCVVLIAQQCRRLTTSQNMISRHLKFAIAVLAWILGPWCQITHPSLQLQSFAPRHVRDRVRLVPFLCL